MGCGDRKLVQIEKPKKAAKPEPPAPVGDFHCAECGLTLPRRRAGYRHRCVPGRFTKHLRYQAVRAAACESCEHNTGGICAALKSLHPDRDCHIPTGVKMPRAWCPVKKEGWHRTETDCPKCGRAIFDQAGPHRCACGWFDAARVPAFNWRDVVPEPEVPDLAGVQLVTVHFNPMRYRRARETFYEWRPSLGRIGDCLRCVELVFDDDEPEIEGSVVVRGTRAKNWMWQKEALINLELSRLPGHVRYFGWLDHDILFQNPRWLADAIPALENAVAVQLFDNVRYLDQAYKPFWNVAGRAATGKGNPGGAWLARRDYLDSIGGLLPYSVIGGGDQWTYAAMCGDIDQYFFGLAREVTLSPALEREVMAYYEAAKAIGSGVAYVPGDGVHLFHGSMKNKQYMDRDKVMKRHDFDPAADVRLTDAGLLEWTGTKPALADDVRAFFEKRREDG